MKRIFIYSVLFICLGIAILSFLNKKENKKDNIIEPQKKETTGEGFALVELFTSEGCSSCPTAEALMSELQKQYADSNVYFLEYHVDYWDRLGWKDKFSTPQFSELQRQYASYLNLDAVYTPQAVINGMIECVGSDKVTVSEAINNNLKQHSIKPIDFKIGITGNKILTVTLSESIVLQSTEQLKVALVLNKALVNIRRGENEGLNMEHLNTVLELKSGDRNSTINFSIADNVVKQNLSIVIFIQVKQTGKIINAIKKQVV